MQLLTFVLPLALLGRSLALWAGELVPFRLDAASPRGAMLLAKPSPGGDMRGLTSTDSDEEADVSWFDGAEKKQFRRMMTAHFGDTACPCIGFDNIEGSITLSHDKDRVEETKIKYPADVGSRCETWEDGRHPDCKPGAKPGPGTGWCAQAWCFVDACNCHIPIRPQLFTLNSRTLFRGRRLHYSYATCGGENVFNDVLPSIGKDACRCVGFSDIPGQTEVVWKNQTINYPAEMGGSCHAWDEDKLPMCRGSGEKPDFCTKRWCFVDPCECNLPTPPKVTSFLPWATFTGKSLYYSYETCGNADSFTATLNPEACVNQLTKKSCLNLFVRNGVQKCAWTGEQCLGAELVSHPLCAHIKKKVVPSYMVAPRYKLLRSQARSLSGAVVLQLLLALTLGRALIPAGIEY